MRSKFTTNQLLSANNLLKEIREFVSRKLGNVENVSVLKHNMMENTILIKYEKTYVMGGDYEYEFNIVAIPQSGELDFVNNRFKDAFERAAFLSECLPLELDDYSKFEIIN